MPIDNVPDFNATGRAISLSYPIDPQSMHCFYPGQTLQQLVRILSRTMYAPESHRNRIWLLSSEFECVLTYLVCFWLVHKKKSLGDIWFFRRKDTSFGSYYVANAVMVLSTGCGIYLVFWDAIAIFVAIWSFANGSTMLWWWVIPLPWCPLILGAYCSIHGFIVSCSPRSPLSPNNIASDTRRRWIYLPMPRSPATLNTLFILPCAALTTVSICMIAIAGHAIFQARSLANDLIPADIMSLIHLSAKGASSFPGEHLTASDDLVWAARRVAAAYLDCHRYVCIHLAIYASFAFAMWIPFMLYGVPNLVNLVDHACSHHPKTASTSHQGFVRRLVWLLTEGRPRATDSNKGHHVAWKMTVLALAYVLLIVIVPPTFAFVPVYIVAESFPGQVSNGDVSASIGVATIAVSVITLSTCTFITLFCTVASLDPLFRAAIGLNVARSPAPIDIKVVQHRSEHMDPRLETLHDSVNQAQGTLQQPSTTSFRSTNVESDCAKEKRQDSVDDLESLRHLGAINLA